MKKNLSVIFLALFIPGFVSASVRINEIAWMGTVNSSSDEWIELYNDAEVSQDINDWSLSVSAKKLSGILPAHGYYILERTDDTTLPGIVADAIYTGALNDTGLQLVLKDASGAEASVVDASAGWPAGDKDTKETMQWNGSGWITATGTPKAENAVTGSVKKDETGITPAKTESDLFSSTIDTSSHVSPLPLSSFSQKQELYMSAGRNRIVAVGTPVTFEAYTIDSTGKKVEGISSVWSFGDGTSAGGVRVNHLYKYPGDYIVVLNGNSGANNAVSRAEIRVFDPKAAVQFKDGGIMLANNSAYEFNIGGWKLRSGNINFVLPGDTILGVNKEIIFPEDVSGISTRSLVEFVSPNGKTIASVTPASEKVQMNISSTSPVVVAIPVIEKKTAPAPVEKQKSLAITALASISKQDTSGLCGTKNSSACGTSSGNIITLKKPENFFSKIAHFFFR